ncbi:hypothetical protein B9Z55_013301 [Caenorhabditis nigoni]|nr:hypothetical protein B9Z55_013301 [Caenorhabditis nigoni]
MRATGTLVLLLCIFGASGERPKITDSDGNLLLKISDIPIGSCGNDSYSGLAFMNGELEKCDRWNNTVCDKANIELPWKMIISKLEGSVLWKTTSPMIVS